MTECLYIAHGYTKNDRVDFSELPPSTIFVNEVLESEKLKVVKFNTIIGVKDIQEDLHQFHKHHHIKSLQPTENDYKKDSIGRKYRSYPVTDNWQQSSNCFDEYVARDSVTIPRYLIVFQPQRKWRKKKLK